MQKFKKYFVAVAVIIAALYDLLVLIIRKDFSSKTFWVAFVFTNISFLALIIGSIVVKTTNDHRGLNAVSTILSAFVIGCVLLSFLMYGFDSLIDKVIVWAFVPFIFLTGLVAIVLTFGLLNGAVIRDLSKPKPMMFSSGDVATVLENTIASAKEETLRNQLRELLNLAQNAKPSSDPEVKKIDESIFEYVQFLHKNVTRNETSNVYNNLKKVKNLYSSRFEITK